MADDEKRAPGRPHGSRNKRTVLMEQMLEGDAEKVARAVIKAAQDGDMQAARLVFDRCYPAPKGRLIEIELPEVNTVADLVPAHGAILAAICTGQITPDEGATLAAILESRRKAIETVDLEKRIAAMEEKQR
jgi:hypothetical protein